MALIFFVLFIFFLLSSLSLFPYYSYFDENNSFFVRKYFFFKKKIDLSKILRMGIKPVGATAKKFMYVIELWTNTEIFPIRTIGILSDKSNIDLLKRILKVNPRINLMGKEIEKYYEASKGKKVRLIDVHGSLLFYLIFTLFFTIFFVYSFILSQFS